MANKLFGTYFYKLRGVLPVCFLMNSDGTFRSNRYCLQQEMQWTLA